MKRAAGLISLIFLSACGGGEPSVTTVESPQPSIQASASSSAVPTTVESPAVEPTVSPPPSTSRPEVGEFFEAVAEADGDMLREAQKLTAAGSPAWYYALALGARFDAFLDSGSAEDPASYSEDDRGNPQICNPEEQVGEEPDEDACVTYTDIRVTPDGKMVNFKINGRALSERITTSEGRSVTVRGVKYTRIACYKNANDNLNIMVGISTRNQGLANTGADSATYRDSSGRQRQVNEAVGPSEIAADSNATVAMFLNKGRLGGTVTMNGYLDDGEYTDVVARLAC